MTVMAFITEIESMYGNFTSEGMKKAVASRISKLSESQLDKLFETYIRLIPGTYKPDLKNILDCMDKVGIKPEAKIKCCASCGHKWQSTMIECPCCSYTEAEGDPKQYYYEFINDCGRFNRKAVKQMLQEFAFKSKFKEGANAF